MAEVILFTGKIQLDMLRSVAHGASQPAVNLAARPENAMLKKAATEAKFNLRHAMVLRRRLDSGSLCENSLSASEKELLWELPQATLLRKANAAIIAFGHGTLRNEQGNFIHIGGSTGGFARMFLENYTPPDTSAWSSNHP